ARARWPWAGRPRAARETEPAGAAEAQEVLRRREQDGAQREVVSAGKQHPQHRRRFSSFSRRDGASGLEMTIKRAATRGCLRAAVFGQPFGGFFSTLRIAWIISSRR